MSSYDGIRFHGPNGTQPQPQAQMYPRPGVQVQIPRYPSDGIHQANLQSINHNRQMLSNQYGPPRQTSSSQNGFPQAQTSALPPVPNSTVANGFTHSAASTISPAMAEAPLDYQLLVISMAEDYFAAAFGNGSVQQFKKRETQPDVYYKLIATGLGCLEVALREFRLQPKLEASTRFRYAFILYQETENYVEAEEALSQGISLCDRHRFLDMKYNMQHLLSHVVFATNPRASLKFLDGVIKDVEAYHHVAWIYAFRLLRTSLSLKMGSHQENLAAINQLKITSNLANRAGDHAISAIASTMEAMTHLHRSNSAESIEQAQRALAAARSSQLDPAAQNIPQLTSMMHFVDINCSLQQIDPPQAVSKMHGLHQTLDTSQSDPNWTDDGLIRVPVSPATAKILHDSGATGGVLQVDSREIVKIVVNWLPKEEVYALGYLLSAAVTDHRNASDGQKSEKYIKEAKRMVGEMLEPQTGSLMKCTSRLLWRHLFHCHVLIHQIFALCARSAYPVARSELSQLTDLAASLPPSHAPKITILITYLTGVIAQSTGDLSTALPIFLSATFSLSALTPTTPSTHQTLTILSVLNALLIISSPTHPSHHLLPSLLSQLDPLANAHPSKNIHAAYHLLRATFFASGETPSIINTKKYLQLALHGAKHCANNQLLTVTLNFMSWKFFRGSVGDQAEKSARASIQLAKKGRDSLWISVADGVLAETLESRGKGEEAEGVRREGREIAGKLPGGMQRFVGDGGEGREVVGEEGLLGRNDEGGMAHVASTEGK